MTRPALPVLEAIPEPPHALAKRRDKEAIVLLGVPELLARGAAEAKTWPARVDFIEDLMTSVMWAPATGRLLATIWGLSASSIGVMSGEASRRVLKAYKDAPEEVVARLCAGLDHVVKLALAKERHVGCKQCGTVTSHPDPDCNSAIKGQVALAQILGLAPNRHDMEMKYEALDDVALMRTVIRAAIATPHLRPVLIAELERAKEGFLEGGAPMAALPPAELSTGQPEALASLQDSPADSQGHGPRKSERDASCSEERSARSYAAGAGERGSDEQIESQYHSGKPTLSAAAQTHGDTGPRGPAVDPGLASVCPAPVIPAVVAQLEERPHCKRPDAGSTPAGGSLSADCSCDHPLKSHYLAKACWQCHCLAYSPKES